MTTRSDHDLPATIIAAVVGVLIIAAALPFTIAAFPQTPKSYDATWGERAVDTEAITVAAATGTYKATLSATDFQPASIMVETTGCSDSANPSLQQSPASLRVVLRRDGSSDVLHQVDFPCSEATSKGTFTVSLGSHYDIAGAQAQNAETAEKIVWLDAVAANTTASYTLEVTPSRAASSIPPGLPGPLAPTLAASLKVTLNGWDVTLNEHQKEVLR